MGSPGEHHHLPILFDQYSRYRAVVEVLREMTADRPVRLLDVGSGPECLLHQLLPGFPTVCIDPLLAGREAEDRIAGDVNSPALDGQRFDLVVSIDTLEHVESAQRHAFLARLSGLATSGIVVAAPFSDVGEAERTDLHINEMYRRFTGRDYSWLEEHFSRGLPSLARTRATLESLGWQCELVPNAHAPWLRSLLPFLLVCLEVERLRPFGWRLSDWFNRNLAPYDDLEPAYRWLVVARRPGGRPLRASRRSSDAEEADARWRELWLELPAFLLEAAVEALRDVPAVGDEAERAAREVDEWRLRESLVAASKRIVDLEREVASMRAEVERKSATWAEIDRLRGELAGIHSSRLWRLGSFYWQLRRRVAGGRRLLRALVRRQPSANRGPLSRGAAIHLPDAPSHHGCRGYDIVCFPIIDWDFRFQRPQQLCRRFAVAGHRVSYVRTRFLSPQSKARWSEREPLVFDLELPAARDLNLYADEIDPASRELALAALDDFRRAAGDHPTVCVVQLPFWAPLAKEARVRWGWRLVYDCMDEHSGFANTGAAMLAHEEELVADADLVVTSARALYEKTEGSRRRLLLPNAADFSHFHSALRAPAARNEQPVVGYYGAIAEWFDTELVAEAARRRPEWRFVLIGSTFGAAISELARLPNVELLGERPYHELPRHLAAFDVAIIPFHRNELTRATNPVKFYEYLSAGKPVVAVSLPELEPYREHFYPVDRRADFVPQLEAALAERDPGRVVARVEAARQETWERRQESLASEMAGLYGRATIVIVSYENLDYLRLCLDSIRDNTLYPRYEVVVVDNSSSEELHAFLRERQAADPRLTVLFNEENVGFPRANNQAIERATDSDYVVLLNDDTVVTRGWLARLLRYLERDPSIGLIGPVTNWIGNEAQIPVTYRDLGELDPFASARVVRHSDETFDIPVLAMFCVAMRRRLLDEIGLLDERFGVGMFEDDDFAKRVRQAGLRVVCAEDVFVHHWGKSSFRRLDSARYEQIFEENRRRFEEKWGEPWRPHRSRRAATH